MEVGMCCSEWILQDTNVSSAHDWVECGKLQLPRFAYLNTIFVILALRTSYFGAKLENFVSFL